MTFSLVVLEASKMIRRLSVPHGKRQPLNLHDRLKVVLDCQKELSEKFFPHCDSNTPMGWATHTIGRLMIYKAWLLTHYPMKPQEWDPVKTTVKREDLLMISITILELSYKLESNEDLKQWRWLFETHVQWHALAVTLVGLCVQRSSPLKDKAWAIVDIVFNLWSQRVVDSSAGFVWLPLKKLHVKALTTRFARPPKSLPATQNVNVSLATGLAPGAYIKETFMDYIPHDGHEMNQVPTNENGFWGVNPDLDLDLQQTDLNISNFDVNNWDYTCSYRHDESTMYANCAGWDGFMQDTSGLMDHAFVP
jgi:hypothetical protein